MVVVGVASPETYHGSDGPSPVKAGSVTVVVVPPMMRGVGGGRRLDEITEVFEVS